MRWKAYITIVLCKPAKPDYTKPSNYRGIALLVMISKVLSACIAKELVYQAERLNLLLPNQCGGHPGRTTSDAIHTIINFAKMAAQHKRVATFLFLNVKGAFPSVVVPRLIHDL